MFLHRRHRVHRPKVVECNYHPKFRWKIAGYYVNGKRTRKFFETRREADTFLQQLETRIENLGTQGASIDPRLHVMALECNDKLAVYGKTIFDATEFFCGYLAAVQRSCTFNELLVNFLKAKHQEGHGRRYTRELGQRLKRFGRQFGERMVATITAFECDAWLRSLPLAPYTRNNFRRILSVFFSYAVLCGYCVENLISKTVKARIVDKPVEILTPVQMRALLLKAGMELRAYIAIGGFAGLRAAEISRLRWDDVHLDREFIEVSAANSKTASRRLVRILPNLRSWLESVKHRKGPIQPPNLRIKLEKARKAAKIMKWPQNGLRHSFASYHLAKFQDAAALALQMGHTTTNILFAHYREIVAPGDAEAYWQINSIRGMRTRSNRA